MEQQEHQTSGVSVFEFDNPREKFEYWTLRHQELKQELHVAKLEIDHMLSDHLEQLDSLTQSVT